MLKTPEGEAFWAGTRRVHQEREAARMAQPSVLSDKPGFMARMGRGLVVAGAKLQGLRDPRDSAQESAPRASAVTEGKAPAKTARKPARQAPSEPDDEDVGAGKKGIDARSVGLGMMEGVNAAMTMDLDDFMNGRMPERRAASKRGNKKRVK